MSTTTDALDQLIDAYLGKRVDFMSFWRAFMESWADGDLSGNELERYEEAYETVYMGGATPVGADERVVGVLPEEEVRSRLSTFRARGAGASPA